MGTGTTRNEVRHSESCRNRMPVAWQYLFSHVGLHQMTFIATFLISSFCLLQKSTGLYGHNFSGNAIYHFQYFPEPDRLRLRDEAKKMFYFGYQNYMKYAFPKDELNPIHCKGRGPDYDNPSNINVNDVLGDYSLTLIDCLDTLAIIGNSSEFRQAVQLVIEHVSFNKDNIVQVFEATIRVLGGLLAAHLLVVDPLQPFGNLKPDDYNNELLHLAHDLANRLLPAFEGTNTNIPWPRINLKTGVPFECSEETCTAGAGTLLIEFGILGRLLGDSTFENLARKTVNALWKLRAKNTGLLGNVINVQSGDWVGKMSGLGAGIDSFYEYLLKSYIMFGDASDLKKFNEIYKSIKNYMRKGRAFCNNGSGDVPIFVNVNMFNGQTDNTWIDSLQAAFSGVQILRGDIEEAICSHAMYYAIWQRYGALPERFNWHLKKPDVKFYPLRPEFVESTYLLYQATKHPFYLHVGAEILKSLDTHTKAKCGYATIHDVEDKSLEDRMESFFLSETCKYLYLLFDHENPINRDASNYIFSTEGHVFRLNNLYRSKPEDIKMTSKTLEDDEVKNIQDKITESVALGRPAWNTTRCAPVEDMRFSPFPLKEEYLIQIEKFVGLR